MVNLYKRSTLPSQRHNLPYKLKLHNDQILRILSNIQSTLLLSIFSYKYSYISYLISSILFPPPPPNLRVPGVHLPEEFHVLSSRPEPSQFVEELFHHTTDLVSGCLGANYNTIKLTFITSKSSGTRRQWHAKQWNYLI